jgi:hypothetical protein
MKSIHVKAAIAVAALIATAVLLERWAASAPSRRGLESEPEPLVITGMYTHADEAFAGTLKARIASDRNCAGIRMVSFANVLSDNPKSFWQVALGSNRTDYQVGALTHHRWKRDSDSVDFGGSPEDVARTICAIVSADAK